LNEIEQLKKSVESKSKKIADAEKNKDNWFANTAFLSSLSIMLILPIIAGAYLGSWLDEQFSEYSVGWTASLVIVGVFIGAMNVYFLIQRGD